MMKDKIKIGWTHQMPHKYYQFRQVELYQLTSNIIILFIIKMNWASSSQVHTFNQDNSVQYRTILYNFIQLCTISMYKSRVLGTGPREYILYIYDEMDAVVRRHPWNYST